MQISNQEWESYCKSFVRALRYCFIKQRIEFKKRLEIVQVYSARLRMKLKESESLCAGLIAPYLVLYFLI